MTAVRNGGARAGVDRGMAANLIPLDEATDRLRPYARRYVGVRPIDVSSIVGTEGRAGDFDREFHALKPGVRERRRRVAAAFPNGDFAPIVAYKLGDAYFVVDGHRPRRRRAQPWDGDDRRRGDRADGALAAECGRGSRGVRPRRAGTALHDREWSCPRCCGTPVRFTRAVGYRQLLETIQVHGYHLMLDAQRPLERSEIARHWYSRVYLPTAEVLVDERLDGVCPDAHLGSVLVGRPRATGAQRRARVRSSNSRMCCAFRHGGSPESGAG